MRMHDIVIRGGDLVDGSGGSSRVADVAIDGDRNRSLRQLSQQLIELDAAGRRAVLVVDEAHVLPEDALEGVRLLTNLETERQKLLQVVLFGQPELDQRLAEPGLRQLRQRIAFAYRLRPLSRSECIRDCLNRNPKN